MAEASWPEFYQRHDLLDVEHGAWVAALAGRPDLTSAPHVTEWSGRSWPVILRRRNPGEPLDHVPVGLPLPPGDGRRRIGLMLPSGSVRPRSPVTLAQAFNAAPPAWRPTLQALDEIGRSHGLVLRVFGSLLWQHLTGLAYLSDSSDLDLLWPTTSPIHRSLLNTIAAVDADAPMRIDGEILLRDGRGVNWRELHGATPGDTVLAKQCNGLSLCEARTLFAEDDTWEAA